MGRLIVVGCVALALVGCSSSVKVEDATVTLPRVALVTATPNLVRDAAAATRATVQTGSTDAANTGGNGAAPVTGDGTVVTVIATEEAMLRAQPTTEAEALLQVPPGRNLALVGRTFPMARRAGCTSATVSAWATSAAISWINRIAARPGGLLLLWVRV